MAVPGVMTVTVILTFERDGVLGVLPVLDVVEVLRVKSSRTLKPGSISNLAAENMLNADQLNRG